MILTTFIVGVVIVALLFYGIAAFIDRDEKFHGCSIILYIVLLVIFAIGIEKISTSYQIITLLQHKYGIENILGASKSGYVVIELKTFNIFVSKDKYKDIKKDLEAFGLSKKRIKK